MKTGKQLKWIIGYVDGYDAVHWEKIYVGDSMSTHEEAWPSEIKYRKWRWSRALPNFLNCYQFEMDFDTLDKIWAVIDKNK